MIKLNEKHHAYLVLNFYILLKDKYGDKGIRIFKKCSQEYGESRGKRMALRAIGDGHELGMKEYFAYSEWTPTPDFYNISMEAKDGIIFEKVTKCPWASVFRENNLTECGLTYCKEIDKSLVRGFNPDLKLDVTSLQHDTDSCQFYFKDQKISSKTLEECKEVANTSNYKGRIMPFNYHCANMFYTFSSIIKNILKDEGQSIINTVVKEYIKKYGEEYFQPIQDHQNTDFTLIH